MTDLFAAEHDCKKIGSVGDLLVEWESHIESGVLAAERNLVAPRTVSPKMARPLYPTETMMRAPEACGTCPMSRRLSTCSIGCATSDSAAWSRQRTFLSALPSGLTRARMSLEIGATRPRTVKSG